MKKFKNLQRPRRKYKFNIVGHKKALKIWWDSPCNCFAGRAGPTTLQTPTPFSQASTKARDFIAVLIALRKLREIKLLMGSACGDKNVS